MRAGTIGVISSKAARYRAALRDSEDTGEEATSEEDEATEVRDVWEYLQYLKSTIR